MKSNHMYCTGLFAVLLTIGMLDDGGIFGGFLDYVYDLGRQTWALFTAILIIVATIGGVWYALQGGLSSLFGGSKAAAASIVGFFGLVLMVILTFVVVPEVSQYLQSIRPEAPF